MFTRELTSDDGQVRLIKPDIERDAPLSVQWLADPHGRYTLRMMGVPDKYNTSTDIIAEKQRVSDFLDKDDQFNWAIELDGQIIGAIWIDREPTKHLPAPALSFMIGDPEARGKGAAGRAATLVLDYMRSTGCKKLYARHLTNNAASAALLQKLGFVNDGKIYTDDESLEWQNTLIEL